MRSEREVFEPQDLGYGRVELRRRHWTATELIAVAPRVCRAIRARALCPTRSNGLVVLMGSPPVTAPSLRCAAPVPPRCTLACHRREVLAPARGTAPRTARDQVACFALLASPRSRHSDRARVLLCQPELTMAFVDVHVNESGQKHRWARLSRCRACRCGLACCGSCYSVVEQLPREQDRGWFASG